MFINIIIIDYDYEFYTAISIDNPISNRNDVIVAAVVPIVFLIVVICLIIFGFSLIMYFKVKNVCYTVVSGASAHVPHF